jgi:3-hydroxybutyrate dehydrogenase
MQERITLITGAGSGQPMPKGVFISIEELYGIVAFLVNDCARNITGQAITVDGGWTVQ